MRLYLDDIRPTPTGYDLRAYTAEQAITMLKSGAVTWISFDHDLGESNEPQADGDIGSPGTGYEVACWIENEAHNNPHFTVPEYAIHSANPVGARNIEAAMRAAYNFEQVRPPRSWRMIT